MIKFLFKGLLRDKNRSMLPIIVITIGVMLTVLLSGYIRGVMGDLVTQNAKFETGHVKVMTRAYAINKNQLPNDLAILGADTMVEQLQSKFPDITWVKRIRFGGLMDVPDANGETKAQGPVSGLAIELFNSAGGEVKRLQIAESIVDGNMPTKNGELLISDDFAKKLKLHVGDKITYFGSTMNGSMVFKNFIISGTIRFGSPALDKGSIIIDIADAQEMLDMQDATAEILGYFHNDIYNEEKSFNVSAEFNAQYANDTDEFAPEMFPLKSQNDLADYLDYVDSFAGLFVFIFILAMSVVLWNTGLIGGLRRYKEFGIRLALGESKGKIYRSLIYEAVLIGIVGSVIGTAIGVAIVMWMQTYGIDISSYLENSTMMMPSVLKARFTPDLLVIGFIPGLLAMVFGNMLSGIGIYKRQTATLFKELEL